MRRMFWFTTLVALVVSCAAFTKQKSEPIRADEGEFKNLKVLPHNITREQLLTTMRTFARSLGTTCGHCHAAAPAGSKERFDFASDEKPEKTVARTMIRMTGAMNQDYVSKVAEKGTVVTCYMCHRGKITPDGTLPPAPPAGEAGGATPPQEHP